VFSKGFTENDPEYGGELVAPVYRAVTELERPSDRVQVDRPEWLVCMAAAEYVRNDIVRQNQYPNLLSEANNIMRKMKEENHASQSLRRIDIRYNIRGR
jgi:hypothetical protein